MSLKAPNIEPQAGVDFGNDLLKPLPEEKVLGGLHQGVTILVQSVAMVSLLSVLFGYVAVTAPIVEHFGFVEFSSTRYLSAGLMELFPIAIVAFVVLSLWMYSRVITESTTALRRIMSFLRYEMPPIPLGKGKIWLMSLASRRGWFLGLLLVIFMLLLWLSSQLTGAAARSLLSALIWNLFSAITIWLTLMLLSRGFEAAGDDRDSNFGNLKKSGNVDKDEEAGIDVFGRDMMMVLQVMNSTLSVETTYFQRWSSVVAIVLCILFLSGGCGSSRFT